jgi:hypothetical protein
MATQRYMTFYRCRMCGMKFGRPNTTKNPLPMAQLLQGHLKMGETVIHQCPKGDVGIARIVGIRGTDPVVEENP